MSRNEIRLRRQRLTASGANKFRNYRDVLARHEKEVRLKKIFRVFTMFAVILILVMLLIILVRTEKRSVKIGMVYSQQSIALARVCPPRLCSRWRS